MEYRGVDGEQMTDAEMEDRQIQELETQKLENQKLEAQHLENRKLENQERVQREAAALVRNLRQSYDALNTLIQQNPEVQRQFTERVATDKETFLKLRKGLELADQAPRCRWVKQDGRTCRSPQLRKHIYCPQADDGSASIGALLACAGRRECSTDCPDADTEGAD
jgi:hypothetical protein